VIPRDFSLAMNFGFRNDSGNSGAVSMSLLRLDHGPCTIVFTSVLYSANTINSAVSHIIIPTTLDLQTTAFDGAHRDLENLPASS